MQQLLKIMDRKSLTIVQTYSAIVATALALPRLTNMTPVIVSNRPTAIIKVKGSSNKSQAIAAVVGGVKYKRLVTLVAAPLRIIIKSKLMDPIDKGKIAQSKAPTTGAFHTITPDSKKYMQAKHSMSDTPN